MSGRPFPRVTTRGYYDRGTGRTLKRRSYALYPRRDVEGMLSSGEIAVVIHGLRNTGTAAAEKFRLVRERLLELGYAHPVAGFSYDSNTRGAHIRKLEAHALRAGKLIAGKNGRNLALFIADANRRHPGVRIRLLGHSLGSHVILAALERLAKGDTKAVDSVHLFGASISAASLARSWERVEPIIGSGITNYYSPLDAVLADARHRRQLRDPLGLQGATDLIHPKFRQVMVMPENHRFASYAKTLNAFP